MAERIFTPPYELEPHQTPGAPSYRSSWTWTHHRRFRPCGWRQSSSGSPHVVRAVTVGAGQFGEITPSAFDRDRSIPGASTIILGPERVSPGSPGSNNPRRVGEITSRRVGIQVSGQCTDVDAIKPDPNSGPSPRCLRKKEDLTFPCLRWFGLGEQWRTFQPHIAAVVQV